MADSIRDEVLDVQKEMVDLRRDFHARPELGFQEKRTSGVIARFLSDLGLPVRTGIAETGVAAVLSGRSPGRTLLLRADMDALPIQEKNDQPYKSRNPGVMHACGHDGHMAVALAAAKILNRHRGDFSGQVKFVFQPGEEGFAGAREMIRAGVLKDPTVDGALGFHLAHFYPTGTIALRSGPIMASMDSFTIRVLGKGGHAAMPNEGVDAILISSHVIGALQSLISKETSPLTPLVVHVGTIQGGNAFNVVADHVELKGTVRVLDQHLQSSMPERITRLIRGIAAGFRGECEMDYDFGYPPLINDRNMTDLVTAVARSVVGESRTLEAQPIMASDDMAFFLQEVPGCYCFVGCANPDKGFVHPAHNPRFDFDEEAMVVALEFITRAALQYLGTP